MKITITREAFLQPFAAAAAVCPGRSPRESLTYILLDAKGSDEVTLTASDNTQSIRVPVPGVEVDDPGRAMLKPEVFGNIIQDSPDETLVVKINSANGSLDVQGQRSHFKLLTSSPDDFPDFAVEMPKEHHRVPAASLLVALQRTEFCTCTHDKYALAGVLFETDGNLLKLIGTDGRRLACYQAAATKVGNHTHTNRNRVVPERAVRSLIKLLRDLEGDCLVGLTANSAWFQWGDGCTLCTRLIEGLFPDYNSIFTGSASNLPIHIDMPVQHFSKAVRQAAIACDREKGSSRATTFKFADGTLSLSAQAAERGVARVDMPVAYHDKEISIDLNNLFIGEMLKTLPDDGQVTFKMRDAGSAAEFTDGNGYRYVVMPLSA